MDFGIHLEPKPKDVVTFKGLGVPVEILSNIRFPIATPIQRKVIPKMLKQEDVIAVSRTGSGKTYSYVIPILMKLLEKKSEKNIYTRAKAIVIVPTYELATQVAEVFEELSRKGVHPAVFSGMNTVAHSFNYLVVGHFEVAICTPGRLEHLLNEIVSADKHKPIFLKVEEKNTKKEVSITNEQLFEKIAKPDIVVIDEMDRIFEDKSLSLSLERIIEHLKESSPQYALFSATHNKGNTQIRTLLDRKNMELVEIFGGVSDHLEEGRLTINNLLLQENAKLPMLLSLLKRPEHRKVLVFVSTCKRCIVLSEALRRLGIRHGVLSSAESEESRDIVLKEFKKGEANLLLSTDVGCRGLDIRGVTTMIEYDYSANRSTSVHRVGRMNRGKSEKAVLFSFIRKSDIPTYLAFLNHIHSERPRDSTRVTRICFRQSECGCGDGHRTCSYLGLGNVPRDFYANSEEPARGALDSEDAGYSGSYEKYARTNPPEKIEDHWVVTSIDPKEVQLHRYFGKDANAMIGQVRRYKSRYNPMTSAYLTENSGKTSEKRRRKEKREIVRVDLDKFKDQMFIPYENIKSATFNGVTEKPVDKTQEIKERVRRLRKPSGQLFTEWKKDNRERLAKGHLLKRGPSSEEEKTEKTKRSEGATRSVKKVLELRQKREKEAENRKFNKKKRPAGGRFGE